MATAPAGPLLLVVLDGPSRGAVHSLLRGRNRIGRDPACEVVVPDERVSRAHAELEPVGGHWMLRDLGSRNGTWLNGVRCEQAPLDAGDELVLGGVALLAVGEEAAIPFSASSAGRTTIGLERSGPAAELPPRPASSFPARASAVLVGESPAMAALQRSILKLAPTDAAILVAGESGTGKELVAEAVHRNSRARGGPFVAINGAVLQGELLESELFGHEQGAFTGAVARRKGAFELADGGTLFLDEIGELAPETQAALLRVIEGKGFRRLGGGETLAPRVRLIAATHRDLGAMAREGRFREDLLFRLSTIRLDLPPLRERPGDVRLLAEHFLAAIRERTGTPARRFSDAAIARLEAYRFPGNVRELRNIVERIAIFCDREEIAVEDLPAEVREYLSSGGVVVGPAGPTTEDFPSLRDLERAHVLRALEAAGGNKAKAARLLGIDRATLYAKLERYGVADGAGGGS